MKGKNETRGCLINQKLRARSDNKQIQTADDVRKRLQNFQTKGGGIFMDRKKDTILERELHPAKQTRWHMVALKYQC